MLGLVLLVVLISSVKGSGIPWFPYIVPIHTGHRHTTHIVTHPIVHTRLLVLGDGERHNHGPTHHLPPHGYDPYSNHYHNHLYQHNSALHQSQPMVYGRYNPINFPKSAHPETKARHHYPEDYSKFKYGYMKQGHHHYHSEPKIKYSVPVSESPWKPLAYLPNRVPKGYLPLKYLGLDEGTVSNVVKDAINEIDSYIEPEPKPRYPTGIQDVIGDRRKPLSPMYPGAVFYDEDDAPRPRHQYSRPGQIANYHLQKDQSSKSGLNLNIECQCQ